MKLGGKLAQESKLALANGAALGILNKAPLRAGNEAADKALNGRVLQNKKHTLSSTSNKNQNKDSQGSSIEPTKIRKIETVVECSSYEQALNKALQELGAIDQATRTVRLGRLKVGKEKVVGFNSKLGNIQKEFRIDYDPATGPHINITMGKGASRSKTAFTFPGTEEDVAKIIKRYDSAKS